MSEQESSVCEICGGVKSLGGFVQAERDGTGVKFLTYDGHPACVGHYKPAPKHDGKLGEDAYVEYRRYPNNIASPCMMVGVFCGMRRIDTRRSPIPAGLAQTRGSRIAAIGKGARAWMR